MERLVELLLSLQDHLEASNPEVWRMEPQARTQFRGQVASRLRAPDTCSLVAEHERDGVVGVIFGRIIVNKRYSPPRTGMVDQVFVAENHRRAGVGSRLVAELCCFFGQRGIDDLSLRYVTGNQEAAGFWADLGFVPRITIVGASRQVVAKCLAQTHCT
jgi:GNAT superfamily N-acetyltransferase